MFVSKKKHNERVTELQDIIKNLHDDRALLAIDNAILRKAATPAKKTAVKKAPIKKPATKKEAK